MKKTTRARAGQRITEALTAIKLFEKKKLDWDANQLAIALGISNQQARALIATLAARGELAFADVTVRRRRLVLTASKSAPARAA